MSKGYTHLHVHSTYSLLDGAAKIDALFAEAQRLEMPALAITDHGNLFGAAEFYRRSLKGTVKPILGIEAYVSPSSRHHKKPVYWGHPGQRSDDVSGSGAYTHLTLLARDATGLRNLFRLSSLASIEGFYQKARVDRELLAQYSEGVIATTGCPSGEVQTWLRLGQSEQALQAAADYRDIFGADSFYLELMDHGLPIERNVREDLLFIGRKLGITPVATNDSHYVTPDQTSAHDALLCVQTGKKMADADRFRFEGEGYYLKSAQEMRAYWDAEVPGACDTTLAIADQVGDYAEVFANVDRKPRVPLEPGDTEDAALRREVQASIARHWPGGLPGNYRDRLDTELDIISRMGFPGYFLVIADLVRWAHGQGYFCRARGSAAGSLVAYVLGITDIDPVAHNLYFERFINPDRVSPPDIDIDVDDRHRGALTAYLTDTYGADKIAQVATFGTIKTRAATTDAARVLDQPIALAEKIKKALPRPIYAQDVPMAGVFDPTHERYGETKTLRLMAAEDERVAQILDTARGLEGLVRNTGVHACGVFLSSEPLIDVIPLWMRQDDGAIVTGWEWSACEDVGLLKMDLLGSATLHAIAATLNAIKANHGVAIDLPSLPLDDPATYELLASGATQGIFQFEESGAAETLRRVAPTCFEDICAATALHRPGPMETGAHHEYADRKNGKKTVKPIHPELAESLADILGSTFHLLAYQEQVMSIARKVAGYTLAQADILRRAMGKKKKEVLDAEYPRFQDGMTQRGYSQSAIKTLWDAFLPFTQYGFNYSHAASYGLQSYWTAYLKAHYPAEFMAGRLSSTDKTERIAIYLGECRRIGIAVLPPCVNASGLDFTAVGGSIRFGLGAVRNVGEGAVRAIIDARDDAPFTSLADFLTRIDLGRCNKRVLEALVKAGALDTFGHPRRALLEALPAAVDGSLAGQRRAEVGQGGLFDDEPPEATEVAITGPEWPLTELLAHEREQLGLYVSAHPLDDVVSALRRHSRRSLGELLLEPPGEGESVALAGMITKVAVKSSKAGRAWAAVTVEDIDGQVECRVLGKVYETIRGQLVEGAIVAVTGTVADGDGPLRILVETLTVIDPTKVSAEPEVPAENPVPTGPFQLILSVADCTRVRVEGLREVMERHPGDQELRVKLVGPKHATHLTTDAFRIMADKMFVRDLRDLLWRTAAYQTMDEMGMR